MSKVADKFWQAVGSIQQLDDLDAIALKEEMVQAINMIDAMKCKNVETPKRGDEIKEFYYVSETRGGCPKIERRAIGIKGITLIEVSNVGNSYSEDRHLSKVRVTGIKEDGKTPYTLFFTNVFTEVTVALRTQYQIACKKHQTIMGQLQNQVSASLAAHDKIMKANYDWLTKKFFRTQFK